MIQRLSAPSLSFRANGLTSARDSYSAQMDKNYQTAQQQNDMITGTQKPWTGNKPIPMHGQGQKLDVMA